uniref:Uncharacterized protein n=1 Tax=Knipowitschia caucasica TaxID=637954 RepID=A0AAV2J431_KNICA
MPPKKDDVQSQKSAAASSDAILAAVNKLGAKLAKVSQQVDGIKKSMEERLDTIEAHLSTLQNDHSQTQQRLEETDETFSQVDVRLSELETTCAELQVASNALKAKINDLEGRSQRLNIRIVGIKEDEEKPNPTSFVTRPKPQDHERPRVIIDKIHNDRDIAVIFKLSRQKAPLQYKGNKVFICLDYTAEVSSQRQAFNTVKKKLTDAGATCTLRFPAKLNVDYNNKVQVFNTPSEAERFASSLSANP